MDVADDVDLIVGAGTEMDIARPSRDGDRGRGIDVEGAVEVPAGGKDCGCGKGENGGGQNRDFHKTPCETICAEVFGRYSLLLEDDCVAGVETREKLGFGAIGDAGFD